MPRQRRVIVPTISVSPSARAFTELAPTNALLGLRRTRRKRQQRYRLNTAIFKYFIFCFSFAY